MSQHSWALGPSSCGVTPGTPPPPRPPESSTKMARSLKAALSRSGAGGVASGTAPGGVFAEGGGGVSQPGAWAAEAAATSAPARLYDVSGCPGRGRLPAASEPSRPAFGSCGQVSAQSLDWAPLDSLGRGLVYRASGNSPFGLRLCCLRQTSVLLPPPPLSGLCGWGRCPICGEGVECSLRSIRFWGGGRVGESPVGTEQTAPPFPLQESLRASRGS
ncbi:hypothetical protein P7K49_035710 [Saguinus oedipus]|uniref:Uncharacterized protein n=1 Tax=Saguinus oedipus TaxID=9490 RepID=A0ABQ9TND1_SAGOE|nr:hypothetical protein P7K49_035710 [Saguinus oedipus]